MLFLCYTLCIVENDHFLDQSSDSVNVRPESGRNSAIAESSNDKNAEEAKDDSVDRLLSVQSNDLDSKRFDPTKAESSYVLERGIALYFQEYFTVQNVKLKIRYGVFSTKHSTCSI